MSEREGGRREGKEEISPAGFEAGEGKECAAPIVLNLGKRQPCGAEPIYLGDSGFSERFREVTVPTTKHHQGNLRK